MICFSGAITIISLNCLCFLVRCPTNLVIPNGYAKFSKDGRSITYHCVGDLKVIGSSSAECQLDGTWSSPLPKCGGTYISYINNCFLID